MDIGWDFYELVEIYFLTFKIGLSQPVTNSKDGRIVMHTLSLNETYVIQNIYTVQKGWVTGLLK